MMMSDNGNNKQQKIHIPASLKNKRKKKTSHRDIANLIHLQKNPDIIKRHQQQQQQQKQHQNKRRRLNNSLKKPREDFITMYMIKWPLSELIKATTILITIMEHIEEDKDYDDYTLINNTPIIVTDDNHVSFRVYYNMIYQSAIEVNKSRQKPSIIINSEIIIEEEEDEEDESTLFTKNHIMNLLRACFLIAFFYDERIKRFVMANHSIHSEYTLTRPPDLDKIKVFIIEAGIIIDDYLFHNTITILDMINQCIGIWVRNAMI
jgi:hypothetical protein